TPAEAPGQGHCVTQPVFTGYTFLQPDIINRNAAYAPFFMHWDAYYRQFYFNQDIQKQENLEEWIERFCGQPKPQDVEYVVYKAPFSELEELRVSTADPKKLTALPYNLAGNTFAEAIALNGCNEVVEYLMFTRKCEPYVVATGSAWDSQDRDTASMQLLIDEGLGRFKDTESHFVRLRYAYQIVRLAHYKRDWQYTVDLYNYLLPKIDRRKLSIVYYWTLGHLAGALQQLGKYPEAAYRYSLIFRYCPSKRTQAYRSFVIRNDQDWTAALRMCQDDGERSTLHILRAGNARTYVVSDMQQVYALEPTNPQLDLLLMSEMQQLEKVFLRTRVTDRKRGETKGLPQRERAARDLIELEKFVRQVLRDGQTPNPKLWLSVVGYLELLAGDRYAAEKSFDRAEAALDLNLVYDQALSRQIATWQLVLEIMNLDPTAATVDAAAFRIRSYDTFKANPMFEPFLQDWLAAAFAANQHPGKAILIAYPPEALGYNPNLDVLNDLLAVADQENPILLEKAMQMDTNPDYIRAKLLEIKGVYLFTMGQPEAALLVLRSIPPLEQEKMPRFSPFREKVGEKINRPVTDSIWVNRRQIIEKILDWEFRAKAAVAINDPAAARYYYLIGLGYYNMSYFGYEWEAMDYFRSGYNQLRLASGPVFPLAGSPDGNRENLDMSRALGFFELAMSSTNDPEMAARATFMAARCQQKQWFSGPDCTYRPGSKLIPVLPDAYRGYYDQLQTKY
ncbi:MAG: hypothetical protein ABIO24_00500, partial [Saprospiraceae bacterium]